MTVFTEGDWICGVSMSGSGLLEGEGRSGDRAELSPSTFGPFIRSLTCSQWWAE